MIPKIIHYCWFGGKPLSKLALKCINSWKKYCPDYEIIEWNESNFDINCCEYVKKAYDDKKWAFVSDYVRLYAMVNYGGIYMDTDVEVVRNLDEYLKHQAFSGFQTLSSVQTGIMACEKKYHIFNKLLHDYDDRQYINMNDGRMVTNVDYITDELLKYGFKLNNEFQIIEGFALYPRDYFCAKLIETGEIKISENTATIHHFASSWVAKEFRIKQSIRNFCIKHFGNKIGLIIYYIIASPIQATIIIKRKLHIL